MATQEFYIRNASETEARGPFTHEHLISLAETGQITRETLYYDAAKEQWVPITEDAELIAVIFPEKVSLKLKSKTKLKTLNVADAAAAPISVDDMLAAAEGRTAETEDKLDPSIARERAAAIGLYSAIVLLLISAAALMLPSIDILANFDPVVLLKHPLVILGAFNTVLAVLLGLQVTQAYPLVRFSAAMGVGLVGFLLWTQSQSTPLAAFALGSAGLYFCTVFVNFAGVGLAAGLGLVGMGGYAFFALTT
ncbi:GYF domain-containing protein [Rariglobus hedericola]|uniref:DUF4339 domain-containing protein n=1 Tax=Rariglobus hedericola TaxID=2597822 RepID=A0A556QEE4_9BACT|nr:GYF domain-containing protein [Rariglobus hedericola]TSJ75019.1 DUF4339 domain-containing protein [Rariglobus hedericola]